MHDPSSRKKRASDGAKAGRPGGQTCVAPPGHGSGTNAWPTTQLHHSLQEYAAGDAKRAAELYRGARGQEEEGGGGNLIKIQTNANQR